MRTMHEKLHIILFEEGDTWAAQCLEHDIAAQGKTMEEAAECLAFTIVAELEMRDGDLSEIQPPPEELRELYQAGSEVPGSVENDPRKFGRSLWSQLPSVSMPEWRVARA